MTRPYVTTSARLARPATHGPLLLHFFGHEQPPKTPETGSLLGGA